MIDIAKIREALRILKTVYDDLTDRQRNTTGKEILKAMQVLNGIVKELKK